MHHPIPCLRCGQRYAVEKEGLCAACLQRPVVAPVKTWELTTDDRRFLKLQRIDPEEDKTPYPGEDLDLQG